ncbi:ABC transporter ATP-binding protein [Mesobaculum littorinae]|uniref:ABC transporter ATP-binding protein n=1 Tax=Mesobaculum littorinae TaxID=2486419 RepID=A0A438AM73_9RHOB|nr:ABC transporter ATP-binding protein [Mesobaculum littorinae]RVV99941.1 ABC transporter ATP-binding protein [Mesobaculum littorinae]
MTRMQVEGLEARYGRAQVLHGVSLSLRGGEVLCLMGRNGAGKTTTLRSVMGTLRPTGGRITLDGRDLTGLPAAEIPRAGIAHVPQGRRLFSDLTVRENLALGLMTRGADTAVQEAALDLFPVLRDRLSQRAGTLSGGEQSMLAMARAICVGPRVLLLDEPTEGLMPSAVATVRAAIARLRADGVAVLLVEQRVEAVLEVGDRVAFMEHGRIRADHPIAEVRADPGLLKRYVGLSV